VRISLEVPAQFMLELLLIVYFYWLFYKAQPLPSFCFSPLNDLHISGEAALSVRSYATQRVRQLGSIS